MFTKAGMLIALLLVFMGYRWGKRKAQAAMQPPPAQVVQNTAPSAAAKQPSWLSVRVLLAVVIVLLVIAIFSSLQR